MSELASSALAIAMIAALLLTLGAVKLLRLAETRKRGWLMIAAAAVLVINVAIWTL
ncbi:MAG TPA: hypothetical protein VFK50_10230 [Sphingomicrobium sp.]|nr:hypothetical protein [Sphingomicrobium sp.]